MKRERVATFECQQPIGKCAAVCSTTKERADMRHRHTMRKLGRSSSHRDLMLRNLVSSLLEHEQIITTLPKAKETARLAEKVITWGKKGQRQHSTLASKFLLGDASTVHSKLFAELAERYKARQGGYTRVLKFGNRPGDHAPQAILQLVDGPRDLKLLQTGRAIGRQIALRASTSDLFRSFVNSPSPHLVSQIVPQLSSHVRKDFNKAVSFRNEQDALDAVTAAAQSSVEEYQDAHKHGPLYPNMLFRQQLVNNKSRGRHSYASSPMLGHKAKAGENKAVSLQITKQGPVQRAVPVFARTAIGRAKGVQANLKWSRSTNPETRVAYGYSKISRSKPRDTVL